MSFSELFRHVKRDSTRSTASWQEEYERQKRARNKDEETARDAQVLTDRVADMKGAHRLSAPASANSAQPSLPNPAPSAPAIARGQGPGRPRGGGVGRGGFQNGFHSGGGQRGFVNRGRASFNHDTSMTGVPSFGNRNPGHDRGPGGGGSVPPCLSGRWEFRKLPKFPWIPTL